MLLWGGVQALHVSAARCPPPCQSTTPWCCNHYLNHHFQFVGDWCAKQQLAQAPPLVFQPLFHTVAVIGQGAGGSKKNVCPGSQVCLAASPPSCPRPRPSPNAAQLDTNEHEHACSCSFASDGTLGPGKHIHNHSGQICHCKTHQMKIEGRNGSQSQQQ